MVQATPFLLVLFLALGAHGLSVKKCSLTGRWVNDLGSNMTIMTMKSNGDFAGIYYTAVSATTKKIERSPLLGSQHQPYLLKQPTFGFTVHWTFSGTYSFLTILVAPPASLLSLPAVSLLIPCLPLHHPHCSPFPLPEAPPPLSLELLACCQLPVPGCSRGSRG
ncbi:avidin-like isoform X1 [Cyanistes caeruleus]|uniref:avidin-like isoform X1 n=1 Tax=Cyanistes caeruleus TaxID=156563 RepID=UPI000CDAF717|nr:avidin-like isoform X1 [Cyanistes caeruleus]